MAIDPTSPLEQLSAEFDGGHVTPETRNQVGAATADDLLRQWSLVGDQLRSIPVRPASRVLNAVRQQREHDRKSFAPIVHTPASNRARFSVFAACTAVAVLLLAIRSASLSLPENPLLATAENTLPTPSADWDVVVVTVSDDHYENATSQLRKKADEEQIELRVVSEGANETADSMDILVASNETSDQVLAALIEGDTSAEQEWNPMLVGDLDREQLLQKVAESMQIPTRSDEHFGEVLVVLSQEEAVSVVKQPFSAGGGVATEATSPADQETQAALVAAKSTYDSTESGRSIDGPALAPPEVIAEALPKGARKPVLFVLKRRKSAEPPTGVLIHSPFAADRSA